MSIEKTVIQKVLVAESKRLREYACELIKEYSYYGRADIEQAIVVIGDIIALEKAMIYFDNLSFENISLDEWEGESNESTE